MADDWIKMRVNLADDPAVVGIAKMAKLDRFGVVGRLHELWSWADKHSVDGFLPYVTASDIDEKVGKRGFAEAMAQPGVGWLVIEEGGVRFPKFTVHNGASAKKRAVDNKRQDKHRRGDNDQSVAPLSGHADAGNLSRSERDEGVTRVRVREREIVGGGGTIPDSPPPPRKIFGEEDVATLQAKYPRKAIRSEWAKAVKKHGPDIDVDWFERKWLPHVPERSLAGQSVVDTQAEPEPEGWRIVIAETAYGPGGNFEVQEWKELKPDTQAWVRDQLKVKVDD